MEWQPIKTAPKDGTAVLLAVKPRPEDRWGWSRAAHAFVGRHPGIADDGFDMGWNFAAPVGYGGITDDSIDGWMPLPPHPKDMRSGGDG